MCSIQGLGKVDAPIPKCPWLLATAAVLIPQTVETCWNINSWPLWFPENAKNAISACCEKTRMLSCTHCTLLDVPWIRSNLQQVRLQRAVEMARGMPCPLRRGLCIVDQSIGTGDPWRPFGDHRDPDWIPLECPWMSQDVPSFGAQSCLVPYILNVPNPPRWQEKESLAKLRLTLAGSCWISHLSFRFHTLFNGHDTEQIEHHWNMLIQSHWTY